jgi:outer membrane protein assembly factor BamE (lipoprotein component of BamABCDE complex)
MVRATVLALCLCATAGCSGNATSDNKAKSEAKGATEGKVYTREQFRALIIGKTREEVIKAVGKPERTQEVSGYGEYWFYRNLTKDPITDKLDFSAQVVFENGVVNRVNY